MYDPPDPEPNPQDYPQDRRQSWAQLDGHPQYVPDETPGINVSGILSPNSRHKPEVIAKPAINMSDDEEEYASSENASSRRDKEEEKEFQEQPSYGVYIEAEREAA